jgi:hypothetical protein
MWVGIGACYLASVWYIVEYFSQPKALELLPVKYRMLGERFVGLPQACKI